MKALKQSVRMLKYNFLSVFLFEIAYRVLSLALLIPILYGLLDYSVKLAGIPYLSGGTVNRYLKAPSTYGILFVMLILCAVFLLINLSGLVYTMEASVQQQKVNPLDILVHGIFTALRAFRPRNFGLILYSIFVVPFTNTVLLSGSLLGVRLPEFFRRFLSMHRFGVMGAAAIYLVLCVTFFHQIFLLNYFILHKASFKEASRMSKRALSKRTIKVLIGTVFLNILMTALILLLEGLITTGASHILSHFVPVKAFRFMLDTIIRVAVLIGYILMATVATPHIYAFICACFYEREKDREYREFSKTDLEKAEEERERIMPYHVKKRQRVYVGSVVILALLMNISYIYLIKKNYVSLRIAYPTRASVTAHRGDAGHAPENTMEAFRLAAENQADIIELDVRQTRDGEYIVMHDESLYRTAGIKRKVGEVDIDYIRKLDVGSSYDRAFDGAKVPTLREVLAFAKEEDIFLNIELKPADTDENFLEGVLALLEEYDYVDECVLASQDYDLLCEVKRLNPKVKTVYVMTMAFGTFGDMENVDVFSIKYTYLSNSMVRDIHAHGKEVYAWTVKFEEDVKELLLLDVDSIITDYPYEVKEYISNANDSMLSDFFKRLLYQY